MRLRRCLLPVVLALTTSVVVAGTSAADPACAPAEHAGGDWRSFGRDSSNTRSQPLEQVITPSTAPLVTKKWSFASSAAGGLGGFQSSPVIADGCLYAGTAGGTVFAMNADTGELVWKTQLDTGSLAGVYTLYGIYSLAVNDGTVFANVAVPGGPYVAALDQDNGDVLWTSIVDTDESAYTNSSPALVNGMVFIGISGPENGPADRRHPGGFALLDPDDGTIIKRTYIVSEEEDARGLKGASIWATPVWDQETNHIYAGTGQPANKNRESSRSNAIVKIDVDRSRSTFGEVVDYYHGDWDDRLDVDFGGSPVLFKDADGNTIVGALQKSGKYHAVFADTMEQSWWARLADPIALGNSGTGAYDGQSIYIAANGQTSPTSASRPNPGWLYALNPGTGVVKWRAPVASGADYHLVSVAGGVVYIVTTHGALLGFDAANGLPVLARSLQADAPDACVNLSSGVAVARNTIYAVCDIGATGGGWIVAYG